MISNIFKVRWNPDNKGTPYEVHWPGKSPITLIETMDKIMNMAFKTGAYQISMFNSNKRFTMDSQAFLTYQEPSASWVVNSLYESLKRIEGIGFPSEDYAIDFIDRAEKYIVWKNLSKNYDVKNTI